MKAFRHGLVFFALIGSPALIAQENAEPSNQTDRSNNDTQTRIEILNNSSLSGESLASGGSDGAGGGMPKFGRSTGFDFSEGTGRVMGQRVDVTQTRAFRSQFETFLTKDKDSVEELVDYQEQIQKILGILSPLNMIEEGAELNAQVEQAYKKLYEVAEHDADNGASRTLAHMIYNTWRLRDEIRQDIRRADRIEGLSQDHRHKDPNSIHYMDKAMIESKTTIAKAQFETQILYFLMQRRYDHAMMAGYFYRMLFKGGEQQLPGAANAIRAVTSTMEQFGLDTGSKFTGGGQGSPVYTVEAIEQFCRAIDNKIQENVESLERTFDDGGIQTALERLQEVFIPGEYVSPVMTLSYEKREVFLRFYRKQRALDEYASAGDYDNMLKVLDEIEAMTNDFFQGKGMRSEAETTMRMSKFKLIAAKKALSDGDFEMGNELMEESVKLWPLNPQIDSFADTVDEKGDATMEYSSRMDEWVGDGNMRKIFENREALGLAFSGDVGRLGQLKEIVREYSESIFLIEQAEELAESAPLVAWDLLRRVPDTLGEDPAFLLTKQKLLMAAMPYAKLLERAEGAERERKWNVALSFYSKAHALNPMSKVASQGIERASKQLLELPL